MAETPDHRPNNPPDGFSSSGAGGSSGSQPDDAQRIADLEKRLMEEREKALMASLKNKEDEAVSARVEVSIKDIQDKLRREKREQDMDEARRRAETRAMELERRLAEEREAWLEMLKKHIQQTSAPVPASSTPVLPSVGAPAAVPERAHPFEQQWAQERAVIFQSLQECRDGLTRINGELKKWSAAAVAAPAAQQEDRIAIERERSLRQLLSEKDQMIAEFRHRAMTLERRVDELNHELDRTRETARVEMERSTRLHHDEVQRMTRMMQEQMSRLNKQRQEEFQRALAAKQEQMEKAKKEAIEKLEQEMAARGVAPEGLEEEIRQKMETEFLDRLRDVETNWETRIAEAQESAKKDIEKLNSDNQKLRRDIRAAQDQYGDLEREAQDLIRQAEGHYKKEMDRKLSEAAFKTTEENKKFFTRLGRWLDTPVLVLGKKK